MAEHLHAQVLRWVAQGLSREIECRREGWPDSQNWQPLLGNTSEHLGNLIKEGGDHRYEFRLKPRTVKIGSREVEAPVLEPGALEIVWYWDTDYQAPDNTPASSHYARRLYEKGLGFATKDSCQAAHDAIHALLRGGV